ncbi:MAG: hypothetical protein LBS28_03495 [Streptococcaceae bacterium]|jgi:hypothetical protein|nr:hypothetical protein [Streptococcaceae bacterium]
MNIIGYLDNYNSEFDRMNVKKAEKAVEMNFAKAKIIPISMGLYAGGYALIPDGFVSLNDAWFWCSHEFNIYEENKFHKLAKTLKSHCLIAKEIRESRTR